MKTVEIVLRRERRAGGGEGVNLSYVVSTYLNVTVTPTHN
jgi:hypothetical protein